MWSSHNEEDGRTYELQYSSDGRSFTGIDSRKSKVSATGDSYYQFDHFLPESFAGKNILYRIKFSKADEREKYSETRVVALKEMARNAIALIPNPAQDHVQIVFNGSARSNWQIGLFNLNGMLVKSLQVNYAS
jgi:hypothetical protein